MISKNQSLMLDWDKPADRQLGMMFLNHLASSEEEPWPTLAIRENRWIKWREAILSPPWSRVYPKNQPQLVRALRKSAETHFANYTPPSNDMLRSLIDILASEAFNSADQSTVNNINRELIAIALSMWIYRSPPAFDDNGDPAPLPHGLTWAIQQLLPHRTMNAIENVIHDHHTQVTAAYDEILRVVDKEGLEFMEDLLSPDQLQILRSAGCEDEARAFMEWDRDEWEEEDIQEGQESQVQGEEGK